MLKKLNCLKKKNLTHPVDFCNNGETLLKRLTLYFSSVDDCGVSLPLEPDGYCSLSDCAEEAQ